MRPEPVPLAAPPDPPAAAAACHNCGAPAAQRFCPACGQATGHSPQRPFREILGEVLEETIALDSRFAHTVLPLLFRPGLVAAEHLAGRRARYTSPLKLYLLLSFLFFVAAALAPASRENLRVVVLGDGASGVSAAPISARETEAGLVELRAKGALGARLADRLEALQAMPPAQVQAHVRASVQENGPRVVFFLVPVLAFLLKLGWRRRYYAEHLVTALHAHAVGFAALLPGELLGSESARDAGVLAACIWALLALRRVYGEGWGRTAAKGIAVLLAYATALGLGLTAVFSAGLLL